MIHLKIAVLNLLRNKRRSLLTLACIAAGILTILIVGGYYAYNYWGLRESMIRSQLAHIQIYRTGYNESKDTDPFRYLIDNPDEIMELLADDPRVLVASPRLKIWSVLDSENGRSRIVEARGIVSEKERLIFTFVTDRTGQYLSSSRMGEMELGGLLAEELQMNVGDRAFLSTVSARGEQNVLQFETCGIISSYSSDFDSILVNIPLETAQILADADGVHEIAVLLRNTEMTDDVLRDLRTRFAANGWDLEVTSWEDQAGYYRQVVQYYGGFFRIILFIICLVSLVTTMNAVIMSTYERITEIGTMRSFGATKSTVLKIMFYEGIVLGLAGALSGILLGVLFSRIINGIGGIPLAAPPGMSTDLLIKIRLEGIHFAICGLLAVCVPLAAVAVPGIKTARMQIIQQVLFNEQK